MTAAMARASQPKEALMSEDIAAALRAAAVPICRQTCAEDCQCGMGPSGEAIDVAAAAVAAFLRVLPDGAVLRLLGEETDPHRGWRDTLASAVEEAARHE